MTDGDHVGLTDYNGRIELLDFHGHRGSLEPITADYFRRPTIDNANLLQPSYAADVLTVATEGTDLLGANATTGEQYGYATVGAGDLYGIYQRNSLFHIIDHYAQVLRTTYAPISFTEDAPYPIGPIVGTTPLPPQNGGIAQHFANLAPWGLGWIIADQVTAGRLWTWNTDDPDAVAIDIPTARTTWGIARAATSIFVTENLPGGRLLQLIPN